MEAKHLQNFLNNPRMVSCCLVVNNDSYISPVFWLLILTNTYDLLAFVNNDKSIPRVVTDRYIPPIIVL